MKQVVLSGILKTALEVPTRDIASIKTQMKQLQRVSGVYASVAGDSIRNAYHPTGRRRKALMREVVG